MRRSRIIIRHKIIFGLVVLLLGTLFVGECVSTRLNRGLGIPGISAGVPIPDCTGYPGDIVVCKTDATISGIILESYVDYLTHGPKYAEERWEIRFVDKKGEFQSKYFYAYEWELVK
jgi:hypothetical protein